MMKIRKYQEKDRKQIEEICLGTSVAEVSFQDALLANFVEPYLTYEKENCYVAVNEKDDAIGYLLGSLMLSHFEKNYLSMTMDSETAKAIREGVLNCLKTVPGEYEAHFHIDIVPSYQNQGIGTSLVRQMKEDFRNKNVRGIQLHVAKDNKNAQVFYKKNGFCKLAESDEEITMGLILNKNIVNPFLPEGVYIADGEPHVFNDRIYIYGSHDAANAAIYCVGDYEVWSAPINDLSAWECHGISYRKNQDPHNEDGSVQMWAPDCVKGPDGRYYLYYCLAFVPELAIAVSSSPEGPFEFYDYVRDENGTVYCDNLPFDPGVFVENNDIYLYTGWGADPLSSNIMVDMLIAFSEGGKTVSEKRRKAYEQKLFMLQHTSKYASVLKLEKDMKTIHSTDLIIPSNQKARGTEFEKHPFFEASSMRKINGRYYFIYSSLLSHELCYALSDSPDCNFRFGGTLISNADIGYQGNTVPVNNYSNIHGSIEKIGNQYYVFYHRPTNLSEYSRQECAEEIDILPDGTIPQVEMTSCGLNNGPLSARAHYSARIVCNLEGKNGCHKFNEVKKEETPYLAQEENHQFVKNMQEGSFAKVKYIRFYHENRLSVTLRGKGIMQIFAGDRMLSSIVCNSELWKRYETEIPETEGTSVLVFRSIGKSSAIDFADFEFRRED